MSEKHISEIKALSLTDRILHFISLSNNKYSNKFLFPNINNEYETCNSYITIICPTHGEFNCRARVHIHSKYGCKRCSEVLAPRLAKGTKGVLRKDPDKFIEDAKVIHGEKYDYSKTYYISRLTPITITCYIHGDFSMEAKRHLEGRGCKKCWEERARLPIHLFIEKAEKVHGKKYDYTKMDYISYTKTITLICNEHGEFTLNAGEHINGKGCAKCKQNKEK